MVFWASDSDFSSVIVECGSVSGVWLVPKNVAAVIEWVLAAAGRAGDSGSCPRIARWAKNGKYEYCGLSGNISSGKYLRPIDSDWI